VQAWLATSPTTIRVEWLPPYAPDLNPVEAVWGHTKYSDLANFAPADLNDLQAAVVSSLLRKRGPRDLLVGFFRTARVDL
jgi:putative transposase